MRTADLVPPAVDLVGAIGRLEPKSLEYLAYQGDHAIVHGLLSRMSPAERERFFTTETMTAFVLGGIERMGRRMAAAGPSDRRRHAAVERVLARFVAQSQKEGRSPRELFVALLAWSEQLWSMSRHGEALGQLERAESLDIRRHPELHGRLLLHRASWLVEIGEFAEAHEVLGSIVDRSYLYPGRNLLVEAALLRGQTALLTGQAEEHRRLLFRGLRQFSTDFAIRRRYVRQLVVGYRGVLPMCVDPTVPLTDRLLALGQVVERVMAGRSTFARLHLDWPVRMALLGALYLLNYRVWAGRGTRLLAAGAPASDRRRRTGAAHGRVGRRDVLVTRAMGGIGDLLMMTPALHALRELRPDEEIQLAIPRRFFPIFEGNPDVSVVDIETGVDDVRRFRRWFNLTDCPAARFESRTVPDVRVNRIELFARALGISGARLRRLDRRPRYFVTESDRRFQQEFWRREGLEGEPVVGLQYNSAESYRDYPHAAALARSLAREMKVLVFSDRRLEGLARDGIVTVDRLPMRQSFALAAGCNVIVAPDSALVHLAGACDVRCVALCGPIDGRLRASAYPRCTVLDARAALPCVPCWRNEVIPCRLTGLRNSACMENIAVAPILAAVRDHLGADGSPCR